MGLTLVKDLADLPRAAELLVAEASRPGAPRLWAFDAPMGAGKTTTIREICRQLGVVDTVSSPTFAIINEYATRGGDLVYHFDFYRLNSPSEAAAVGAAEYFESGSLCLVEWPGVARTLFPERYLAIGIRPLDDGARELSWETVEE